MKKFQMGFVKVCAVVVLGLGLGAIAGADELKTRILRDLSFETELQLNEQTVVCSELGYGLKELKVSIPDLQFYAMFNHSNGPGRPPCATAGPCKTPHRPGHLPEDIIDPTRPSETVSVRVIVTERIGINDAKKTCHREISEVVDTVVRGLPFHHEVWQSLGEYPFEACKLL